MQTLGLKRVLRKGGALIVVLGLIFASIIPVQPVAASPARAAKWDMLINVPLTHPLTAYFNDFVKRVSRDTGGSIAITLRPPGELPYSQDQYLTAVGTGTVAMADASAAFIGTSTIAQIPNLPFLMTTPKQFGKAMKIVKEPLVHDLSKQGAHLLFYYTFPVQTIWGEGSPIHSLGGLQGKKVRASSSGQSVFLQKIGAEPVSLTTADLAQALQRGTVDAAVTAGYIVNGGAIGKLNWGYLLPLSMAAGYIIVNNAVYHGLSKSAKAGLTKAAQQEQARMLRGLPARDERRAEANLRKQGVSIVKPTKADIKSSIHLMKSYWTRQGGQTEKKLILKIEKALKK